MNASSTLRLYLLLRNRGAAGLRRPSSSSFRMIDESSSLYVTKTAATVVLSIILIELYYKIVFYVFVDRIVLRAHPRLEKAERVGTKAGNIYYNGPGVGSIEYPASQ